MRTVKLTIWPDRILQIDDAEFLDLSRRNMILEEVTDVPDAPAVEPASEQASEQAAGPASAETPRPRLSKPARETTAD